MKHHASRFVSLGTGTALVAALYARNALDGTLTAYHIDADGSLTLIQTLGGIPPNGIGLAAK